MCDQMGDEPDPNRCPPDLEDFPLDVQRAIICYGMFGDRVAAEVGYMGKDFTTINLLMDLHGVEHKQLFVETLLLLDQRMIEKSAEALKREREKLKKK